MPPAAAGEEQEQAARTPRAPAGGLRPPAPPAEELQIVIPEYGQRDHSAQSHPAPPAEELQIVMPRPTAQSYPHIRLRFVDNFLPVWINPLCDTLNQRHGND